MMTVREKGFASCRSSPLDFRSTILVQITHQSRLVECQRFLPRWLKAAKAAKAAKVRVGRGVEVRAGR
jgi:hypothetical protein